MTRNSLASPAFPDDDGSTDPALGPVLGELARVLAVLPNARVFVPIVAVVGDVASEGDKNADMAAVLLTGADGRTALLAFSSVDAMTSWNPEARPVPIHGKDAAQATLDEGATALLLDLGGPGFTVIETPDVKHLAAGHRLIDAPEGPVWVQPTS